MSPYMGFEGHEPSYDSYGYKKHSWNITARI